MSSAQSINISVLFLGLKLKNRRRNNEMKEKITLRQPISVKRVNMSLLEL